MNHPCPSCPDGAGKPRTGALGEVKGDLWCTSCGHTWTPSEAPAGGVMRSKPGMPHGLETRVVSGPFDTGTTLTHDHIDAASGLGLESLASKFFGAYRRRGETDTEFRERLKQ